jgi:hypothetical protein
MEGGERDIQLINVNEASSCLAQATVCLVARARKAVLIKPPPTPPTHSPCRILAISGDLDQSRGQPPFRSPRVLQLNLDSNCVYVRIFGAVIGHLEAEIDFWLFYRKWWKFRRVQKIWQYAAILTSRASTTAVIVRKRRCPYKLGGLSPQITWGLHAREATSLEPELFSQTWRKAAVGDSAEPK